MKRLVFSLICLLLLVSCAHKQKSASELRWIKINADSLTFSINDRLKNDWMALSVGNQEHFNAMTISWGEAGRLWNKAVFTVFVSEDRYTKSLMDEDEYFTVCLFPEENHDALVYLGSHSGAQEEDKVAQAGLTPEFTTLGNPVYSEAILYIECRKIYAAPFQPELLPEEIRADVYKRVGIHTMYIGEIVNVMKKNLP